MLGRGCALQFCWSRRLDEDEKDKVAVEEEDEEEMEEEGEEEMEEEEVEVVVVEEEEELQRVEPRSASLSTFGRKFGDCSSCKLKQKWGSKVISRRADRGALCNEAHPSASVEVLGKTSETAEKVQCFEKTLRRAAAAAAAANQQPSLLYSHCHHYFAHFADYRR